MPLCGSASGLICGPVSGEPVTVFSQKGTPVTTLRIRVDNGYTGKDGKHVARIEEVSVKLIAGTAEEVNRLGIEPGDTIVCVFQVSGKEYNDKFYTEIVGRDVKILAKASANQPAKSETTLEDCVAGRYPETPDDSDLPF